MRRGPTISRRNLPGRALTTSRTTSIRGRRRPTASEPVSQRFAIIGGGMSGILAAIKLKERGIEDFTIHEKAARLGGTWRDNTYPGLSCDVPSHVYAYSFELKGDWSHRFSPGAEIQSYFESVADKYGLRQHFRFNSEIARAAYRDGR